MLKATFLHTYLVQLLSEVLVLLHERLLLLLKLLSSLPQSLVQLKHTAIAGASQLQLQIIVLERETQNQYFAMTPDITRRRT